MNDPASFDEFAERYAASRRIFGGGFETSMGIPCPFCGAADWVVCRVVEVRVATERGARCAACGRSARLAYGDDGQVVRFGLIQTGGDPPPSWYDPPPPRAAEG